MYVVSTCGAGFYNEQFLFPFPYSDQVYNETIRDLLLPSGPLKMRDDRGTLVVNGLSLHKVHTYSSDRLHTDTYVRMYATSIRSPSSTPSLTMLMSSWSCWSMAIRTGHNTQLKPMLPHPDHMLCSKCISTRSLVQLV